MADFLHERRDFDQLLAVVANDRALDPMLVGKDYWIMHSLWGLQAQGFVFELKGGTSLSKGFRVIHRFSEDIDIRIEPQGHEPVHRLVSGQHPLNRQERLLCSSMLRTKRHYCRQRVFQLRFLVAALLACAHLWQVRS